MKVLFFHKLVLFILVICQTSFTFAQTDTQFWFVTPETTREHRKEPGVFRINAFENTANVTISMPANPNFQPIYLTVPPNTQVRHEFWDAVIVRDGRVVYEEMLWTIENGTMDALIEEGYHFPNDWEDWTPGIPFNKGLLIESDQNIAVYYQLTNTSNSEIFNLKGRNALGTEFLIPSQNIYLNHQITPNAREKADIVATEDNTTITIELTDNHDIEGHSAGSTFTIILNRGETYSLRSTSRDRRHHLGGIYITSSKPIAITISDDSIAHPCTTGSFNCTDPNLMGGGHYDVVGDQLIPINMIGTEYIAMNLTYNTLAQYQSTDQKVFIWAATDQPGGTQVFINGVPMVPSLTRGEFVMADIHDNAIHITSSAPVYAYQFASLRYELGSAILPPINCVGSRSVSFNKLYNNDFLIQIMTQYKYRNDLIMEPSDGYAHLNDLNWERVAGTGPDGHDDTWYTAVKNFPQNTISAANPYTIRFDPSIPDHFGVFHLSILDVNGVSMSYGYFSSYNSLTIQGLTNSCVGNEVELSAVLRGVNINPNAVELKWYSSSDPTEPFHIGETVAVTESDRYYLEMQSPGCNITNYIDVEFHIPEFSLGENRTLCPGEQLSFEFPELTNGETFQWTLNGHIVSTDNSFSIIGEANSHNELSLTVIDKKHCSSTETINLNTYNLQPFEYDDLRICEGVGFDINVDETIFTDIVWQFNNESPHTTAPEHIKSFLGELSEEGTYTITATDLNNCEASSSFYVEIYTESPPLEIYNYNPYAEVGFMCANDTIVISTQDHLFTSFMWKFTNEDTNDDGNFEIVSYLPYILATEAGTYRLEAIEELGCKNRADITFNLHPQPQFELYDAITYYSVPYTYIVSDEFYAYNWVSFSSGDELIPENTAELHKLTLYEPTDFSLTITNEFGCKATNIASFTWDFSTLLDKSKNNTGISQDKLIVYPNPSIFETVYFNREISGGLYQTDGVLVKEFDAADQINIGGIKSGIYIIQSECGQAVKLVKQ